MTLPFTAGKRAGEFGSFLSEYSRHKAAVVGTILFGVLLLIAILAPVIAPHNPIEQYRSAFLHPPSWSDGFLLGTDAAGRDVLSRLIYGARLSLGTAFVVVTVSCLVGTSIGLIAAGMPGAVDAAVSRFVDILLSIPSILFAVVMVAILGPGLVNAMLAVAILMLPAFIRLSRATASAELSKEYVTAARMIGASPIRILFVTVLPNCLAPLTVQATLGFSAAIIDIAALSFLGLGTQPPTPEWGAMLSDAMQFVQSAPWVVTFPGIAILLAVISLNLIGDGLRDALDPRLRLS